MENPTPVHLEYRSSANEQTGGTRCFLAYFVFTTLGAVAAWLFDGLAEEYQVSLSTVPRAPAEISGPVVVVLFLVCLVLISICALVAAGIFRLICGKKVGRSRRLISMLGTLNGLLGMGILIGCGELENRNLLWNTHAAWNAVIAINIALPAIMALFAVRFRRQ